MDSSKRNFVKTQKFFDDDEIPESDDSASDDSSLSMSSGGAPKMFLSELSSRRLLVEESDEKPEQQDLPKCQLVGGDRLPSVLSDEVLREVEVRSSHRRILSITPQEVSTERDPSAKNSEADLVNDAFPDDEDFSVSHISKDKKIANTNLVDGEDPMGFVRSYVNIHPSQRVLDGKLFPAKKKQLSDEARMQSMMFMNIFINRHEQNMNRFPRNVYITSKYTIWNFAFINLFEQFSRVANFVFLLVTLVQLIPGVSPFNIWSTLTPLIFILLVSAIKEGYEDYCRHKTDAITNSIKYNRVMRDGDRFSS